MTSIEKTKTVGLIDTYTIIYSDGSTSYFTVTNGATGATGKQGIQGIQGIAGKDGNTPVITISDDGYWVVDGTKTNQSAQGIKGETGETGADGKSAYQIAVENGYTGTESQWLDSLNAYDVSHYYSSAKNSSQKFYLNIKYLYQEFSFDSSSKTINIKTSHYFIFTSTSYSEDSQWYNTDLDIGSYTSKNDNGDTVTADKVTNLLSDSRFYFSEDGKKFKYSTWTFIARF